MLKDSENSILRETPRAGAWRAFATTAAVALVCVAAACAKNGDAKTQNAAGAAPQAAASDADFPAVLAVMGDKEITLADLRPRIGEQLDALDMSYRRARHKAIQNALEAVLQDSVLYDEARKQNKSPNDLVLAEAGGSFDPSDLEVTAWYEQNKDRAGGRSLEQLRSQIENFLRAQKKQDATGKLEERLNRERKVVVNLQPFRMELANEGAPFIGPANAAVTLVEFSDFQCPYCSRFYPTIKRLEETHGKDVKIVYRQYPIASIHPYAIKAAEASLCAHEQGKFWELHDLLFEEQDKLTVADLKEKAGRLGLNQSKFNSCLDGGKFTQQVQDDIKIAQRAGVNGTPALFVNGIPIEGGAVSYDSVVKAIEKEKTRVKR